MDDLKKTHYQFNEAIDESQFLNNLHQNEINKENFLGSKGVLTNAYADLIKDIWK